MSAYIDLHRPTVHRSLVLLAATLLAAAGLARADEASSSPTVFQINAQALHDMGITGKGVIVAVVDTGIFAEHPELQGRVLAGMNFADGTGTGTGTFDDNGHGTHVSGTIAAAKDGNGMFGVAYEATLLPIKVLDSQGSGSDAAVANGINAAATSGAFVMNLSLGGAGRATEIENALRNAVSHGMVIVAAAGNDGDASPHFPAGYAADAFANGQIIAVGAVDANNQIASFSNRAGNTKDFYLVAPGIDVLSSVPVGSNQRTAKPGYDTFSGTSMAAPHVTGAVALIKSGWNFLSAQQVANILFVSAKDLGAPGVDDVYGHGLLDLKAALQPIGALQAPMANGARVALDGSSLTATAATSAALNAAAAAGKLRMAGFDSFGRDYRVDMGRTLGAAPRSNALGPMLAAVDAIEDRVFSRFGGSVRLASRSQLTQNALGLRTPSAAGRQPWRDSAMAMSVMNANGREFVFGMAGMGSQAFGLAGEMARLGQGQLSAMLGNPYFSLASEHVHAGVGLPLAGTMRLKVGVLMADPHVLAYGIAPRAAGRHQAIMSLAEVSGQLKQAVWSFSMGRLQERDAVLGATETGALRFAGKSNTNVMSAGIALSATKRLKVGAQYSMGSTGSAPNRAQSLVSGYDPMRSDAYAVFAALQDSFTAGDSLSVTMSQPMRAQSGAMRMTVPVDADNATGAPVMAERSISLKPSGRETRMDVLYMRPMGDKAKWFAGMAVRKDPDNDAKAGLDLLLGAGIRGSF